MENYRVLGREWVRQNGNSTSSLISSGGKAWARYRCALCHVPFADGPTRAPDLSRRAVDRSQQAIERILDQGLGRMPSYDMAADHVTHLRAYLEWLSRHRPELVTLNDRLLERQSFDWGGLPWFEYR